MYRALSFLMLIVIATSWLRGQDQDWEAALHSIQIQDYGHALQVLQKLPPSKLVSEKTAFCHYQLGDWKAAKELYHRILTEDSIDLQSHLYLGIIYDQEYNLPKAILHFRNLVELDTTNTYYLKSLARVYEKANLDKDALPLYQQVYGYNPKDISALLSMSGIWFDHKEYAIADSLASQAYLLDSTNIQVLLTKARCAYSLKAYDESVHYFEKTRGKLDLNPFYQKMLGYAYLQIDSLDDAIHVLSNLLYREQSEYTYSYLAKAHALKEEWDRAIEFYELAIKAGLSENLEQYHLALAKLNNEHGLLKDVIYHFDQAYHYSENYDYIFYKAQAEEKYYKDKHIAADQYRRYLRLAGQKGEFASYANDRLRLLNEYLHQTR